MAENTPVPSGTRSDHTKQDFHNARYNLTVPGTSMANILGDVAVRFVNDLRSNIIMIRMESNAGRSRVMTELDAA